MTLMADNTCQDFKIERKTNKYFTFQQDNRYIYVKPIRNGKNPKQSRDGFASINDTLTYSKGSNSYTVPKKVNKLLVMISKADLQDFNSSRVMPKKSSQRPQRGHLVLGSYDISDEMEKKAAKNKNSETFCTISVVSSK